MKVWILFRLIDLGPVRDLEGVYDSEQKALARKQELIDNKVFGLRGDERDYSIQDWLIE
jgi:hypothetical protein